MTSHKLERVGVFLLRHQRRTRRKFVGEFYEGEFTRIPNDYVFRDSRKVRSEHGAGEGEFEVQIPVRNGVHAVASDNRLARLGVDEPELLRAEESVYRQRRSRNRPASQRRDVGGVRAEFEAFDVAREHLDPRENVVRRADGLGALHMGVSWDQNVLVRVRQIDKIFQRPANFPDELGAGVLEEKAHVGRDLVVAAAGGVELCGGGDFARESLLDVHVHVLERHVPFEFARLDFLEDFVESRDDFRRLLFGNDTRVRQHFRLCNRAFYVELRQEAVEGNGFAEFKH